MWTVSLNRLRAKKVFEISTDIQHATAHNIWIGRNLSYRTAGQKVLGGSPFFRGSLDEVFIFNAPLTQQQILFLMKHNRFEPTSVEIGQSSGPDDRPVHN